jgi:hypothetical protein
LYRYRFPNPKPSRAALPPRPVLRRRNQFSADALLSVFFFDKPAFQISDVVGVTIFDERANAGFEKSDEIFAVGFSN